MTVAKEAAVQTAVRVRAGELGIRLWRNNVGACTDQTGRMIRYGLANDSAQMSKRIKSGDLIGWMPCGVNYGSKPVELLNPEDQPAPRLITAVAVFLSVECKREDWQGGFPTPIDPAKFNDRERAQQRWIDFVRADGGIAGFVRSVAEFEQLVGEGPA